MMQKTIAVIATLAVVSFSGPVEAQTKKAAPQPTVSADGAHPSSAYYRRAPEVRGFVQRRGGYSYSVGDLVNTYGSSRTLYGGNNANRDAYATGQTRSGPFDHGFFFDSGVSPRGGNSPYPN
jgi:hypothetical protein